MSLGSFLRFTLFLEEAMSRMKSRHGRGAVKRNGLELEFSQVIRATKKTLLEGAPSSKKSVIKRPPVHITTMVPPEKRKAS